MNTSPSYTSFTISFEIPLITEQNHQIQRYCENHLQCNFTLTDDYIEVFESRFLDEIESFLNSLQIECFPALLTNTQIQI
jgi:hypothetical protein